MLNEELVKLRARILSGEEVPLDELRAAIAAIRTRRIQLGAAPAGVKRGGKKKAASADDLLQQLGLDLTDGQS